MSSLCPANLLAFKLFKGGILSRIPILSQGSGKQMPPYFSMFSITEEVLPW